VLRLFYFFKYAGLWLLGMQHLFQANVLFSFLAVVLQRYAASLSNSLQTFISVILAGDFIYFPMSRNFSFSSIRLLIFKVIIFHLNDPEAHLFGKGQNETAGLTLTDFEKGNGTLTLHWPLADE